MLDQIMTHVRNLRAWAPDPATLVDRVLDHLDKLHRLVLPAAPDNPSYRYVEVDARRRRFHD
jgi:hypothetical protein